MKIINLYAENLKRLTAVQISPDGNLVQITGKNNVGKTSVLDAIWWALAGTSNVQTTPIRKGEERAIITLDLGKLKITRRFNAQEDGSYTTSITVENDEGARFSSPQGMLDKLLGELTFDPLAFTRMRGTDQVLALSSLVPDFDFTQAEEQTKADFTERTAVNREAKEALAAAEEIGRNLPDEIPEPVSADQLMQDWQAATEHNQTIEARQSKRDTYTGSRSALAQQIETLQAQLNDQDTEIASWPDLPEQQDAESIKVKLQAADATNKTAEAAQRRTDLAAKAKTATAKAAQLTEAMATRKAEAQAAIAGADMPVTGLSIDDGDVHLDGVPFNQASDAQQLHASIGIAMALNPTLKVIRVRDGSLLDDDAMKVLAEMAETNDYQIWIERVDSSGTVGFVLEDGHVKGQELQKPEPEAKAETREPSKPAPSIFDSDKA